MLQSCVAFIAFCIWTQVSIHGLDGYDWGRDVEACTRMKPSIYNMMTELKDKQYYRLEANRQKFEPGEKIHVRIMGKTMNEKSKYSGSFITVSNPTTGRPSGSWDMMHPKKYRGVTCSGQMNAAVAEAKKIAKEYDVEDDVFVWNAPNDCMPGEMFELKGSVVKDNNKILTGLVVELTCTAAKAMPVKPENSCTSDYVEGDLTGTSFEDGFGGWWNDPMAESRWTRHKNKTDSPLTGPSSAYDGVYYVYAEGSYPAKPGDRAILNSPPGLNGCFCVRLWCHLFTGPGTYFTMMVNGIETWNHTAPEDVWMHGWQSVNDANYPTVQLQWTRGEDFRGDLALDKFEISEGLCKEDIGGGGLPIFENGKKLVL